MKDVEVTVEQADQSRNSYSRRAIVLSHASSRNTIPNEDLCVVSDQTDRDRVNVSLDLGIGSGLLQISAREDKSVRLNSSTSLRSHNTTEKSTVPSSVRSSVQPVRNAVTHMSKYESTQPTPYQRQELENYITADALRSFVNHQ